MTRNIIRTAVIFLVVILAGWLLLSFFNTIAHNTTDYTYATWNLFNLLNS